MIDVIKKNVKTSISIASVTSLIAFGGAMMQIADYRYALASDARQVQSTINSHMEQELEDSIMIINMKQNGATQAQIDAALKSKYEARLRAMRDAKK